MQLMLLFSVHGDFFFKMGRGEVILPKYMCRIFIVKNLVCVCVLLQILQLLVCLYILQINNNYVKNHTFLMYLTLSFVKVFHFSACL